jgi:hypothetical protein
MQEDYVSYIRRRKRLRPVRNTKSIQQQSIQVIKRQKKYTEIKTKSESEKGMDC